MIINKVLNFFGIGGKIDMEDVISAGAIIIDVRTPREYKDGHINGSLSIPLSEIGKAMSWLIRDVPTVVVCASGSRSAKAKEMLEADGFIKVYNGGNWESLGEIKAGGCPIK